MMKTITEKPAPAEANPFRRADFVVPILRAWLPLPLVAEVNLRTGPLTQDYEHF